MVEVVSTNGVSFLVSDKDTHLLDGRNWFAHQRKQGGKLYVSSNSQGKTIYLHRLIMKATRGVEVDHINNDTLDNRRENLRLATRSQQCCNRKSYTPASGYRGVYKTSSGSKPWQVRIFHNGTMTRTRNFSDKNEAARVYDELARKHFGEFAVLNFEEGK